MLKTINDTLDKTCLLGLSYFNPKGELLKQTMLAGTVIATDKETGITVQLLRATDSNKQNTGEQDKNANFILPTNLSCWFNAPKGQFHTSQTDNKIVNPDYLVTWDIHQTKDTDKNSEQQWWQWEPRTTPPGIA